MIPQILGSKKSWAITCGIMALFLSSLVASEYCTICNKSMNVKRNRGTRWYHYDVCKINWIVYVSVYNNVMNRHIEYSKYAVVEQAHLLEGGHLLTPTEKENLWARMTANPGRVHDCKGHLFKMHAVYEPVHKKCAARDLRGISSDLKMIQRDSIATNTPYFYFTYDNSGRTRYQLKAKKRKGAVIFQAGRHKFYADFTPCKPSKPQKSVTGKVKTGGKHSRGGSTRHRLLRRLEVR